MRLVLGEVLAERPVLVEQRHAGRGIGVEHLLGGDDLDLVGDRCRGRARLCAISAHRVVDALERVEVPVRAFDRAVRRASCWPPRSWRRAAGTVPGTPDRCARAARRAASGTARSPSAAPHRCATASSGRDAAHSHASRHWARSPRDRRNTGRAAGSAFCSSSRVCGLSLEQIVAVRGLRGVDVPVARSG